MLFSNPGILGINARNLLYIRPYNKKKAIRLADSKLATKFFLAARGIPVPKLYATIRSRRDLEKFDFNALPNSFVLKPNLGYGGEGIIPIESREGNTFHRIGAGIMTKEALHDHISDILDGRFSISDVGDIAFFEQRIICADSVRKFAYAGLPDIRIVVHNLIPVMAMLRLPTRESRGLANLHQGAIGVGIDIARGEVTNIVQNSRIIPQIPGVDGDIRNLKIPHWETMLLMASKAQFITNLGYAAVDIVLDKSSGPMLLEINARAGLAVQIANLTPLRRRLQRIEGIKVATPEKGVRIAQDLFGHKIEKDMKLASGKTVIGIEEDIEIMLQSETQRVHARIDMERKNSLLDRSLATKLGLSDNAKIKFMLGKNRIQTVVTLRDFPNEKYSMIIGKRDLGDFLIDPSKTEKKIELPKAEKTLSFTISKGPNFYDIDLRICEIDKKIKLLHHLTPINYLEEKKRFLSDTSYQPQFEYQPLKFDPFTIRDELDAIMPDDSPLGILYRRKKEEIILKIILLEHIGSENFTRQSECLFGKADAELIQRAEIFLKENPEDAERERSELLAPEQVKHELTKILKKYGLTHWKVKEKSELISNLMAGKHHTLFLRSGLKISQKRLESVIAHEIETHIFTAENGKEQPYQIFNRGTAQYLKTQEGLAVYHQMKISGRESRIAALVLAVSFAMRTGFSGVFTKLLEMGIEKERAFLVASKTKRGLEDTSLPGAFTKDIIYLKGFFEIEEYVAKGGDLKKLFIGKISLEDLDLVSKIPNLKPPKFLPEWVKEPK
ncbi:DUF1704 domain-containing protein [Candidatus Peregrinibacteria bacterium]|nr:DUF1704 domain-containing protein [Candidatus Peregrinibacteria bacterium]